MRQRGLTKHTRSNYFISPFSVSLVSSWAAQGHSHKCSIQTYPTWISPGVLNCFHLSPQPILADPEDVRIKKSASLGQEMLVQIPKLPYLDCMTLGKSLPCAGTQFPHQ